MAVYDRWHKDPGEGDVPCACSKGRKKLYPSAAHLKGKRWQVRWDDPDSPARRQPRRNFALRDPMPGELPDPDKHASALDKEIQGSIVRRDYRDPKAGNVTLREYAEQFRTTRTHGESARKGMESRLRNHVYEGAPGSGRTHRGGVALGQHAMGLLDKRPSMVAAWVASLPLADSSKNLVIGDLSSIFAAAAEDGVVLRNPVKARVVDRPGPTATRARPYSAAEISGITATLPARFRFIPKLGTTSAMRRMEMAALGADDVIRGEKPKLRVLRQLKKVDGELRWGPLKNRKPHDVPVPKEFIEALDAYMDEFPPLAVTLPWHEPGGKLHGTKMTVRLVLSHQGDPFTGTVLDGTWYRAVARWAAPGVKYRERVVSGYGLHRTRHTAASRWLRAGIDVVRVAAWMGDTPEEVMKTYAHLMPDDADGDEAARLASAEFLRACALAVPPEGDKQRSAQLRAV